MPFFRHDDLDFHYVDSGVGIPFIFQHGLGGNLNQPTGLFSPPPGIRLVSMDCRGHGETRPLGVGEKLTLDHLVQDLLALMDHLQFNRAVIGGISMGAALTLRLAVEFPDRIRGLILSRPAWLEGPNPKNIEIFTTIASLIQQHGPVDGRERFLQSALYQEILAESTESAASLVGQFDGPRAQETHIKLDKIVRDAPIRSLDELKTISIPTLVLANRQDPIHPYGFGKILASKISGAVFRELTPKSISVEQHARNVQSCIEEFLTREFQKGDEVAEC